MSWRDHLPKVRGKLLFDEPLAPFTWFRVGGPADVLFLPADAEDLGQFLAGLPEDVPLTVLGVGSNVIVRDGGIEGVVIRLAGRAFADVHVQAEDAAVVAEPGALDAAVARAAARAGIAGLEFYAGIPGTIGGALTMNAGCYGAETKDVLKVAWGVDLAGQPQVFTRDQLGFSYRHNALPEGEMIWLGAIFAGAEDDPEVIQAA